MDKHTNELGYLILGLIVLGLLIAFLQSNYVTALSTLWQRLLNL